MAISDLSVAEGEGKLDLSWTAPGGNGAAVTGYDVHYTSAPKAGVGAVGDHAEASGSDAAAAWVDAGHSGTDAEAEISSLAGGTAYRVRVRAVNSRGNGAWAHETGTPQAPTQPPSGNVMVSNLGQERVSRPVGTNGFVPAQGFTTASNAGGYTLSSIEMVPEFGWSLDQRSLIRAELWSAAADGGPGSKVAELTVPSTLEGRAVASFEAPPNTWLQAATTYFFVPYTTTDYNLRLSLTSSRAEDSNSLPGWSILDELHWQTANLPSTSSWSISSLAVLSIRVSGAASQVAVPAAPRGLGVTPGAAMLDLSWTAPFGLVTGYDVHYTSSATVEDDAAVGSTASSEWVAASRTETDPPTTTQTISGLTNDTPHRVRVRAKNGVGAGAWAFGSGTPKATTTGSTDATLSALTGSTSTDASDFGGTLDIGTFAATTYAYTAAVAAGVTHVKLTPTVNESNATLKVGVGTSLSTVASGEPSGSIALDFGANRIAVEVTAQEGNTQRYTITVHRAPPPVSWAATTATTPEGGAPLTLSLNADPANAMSGTVAYAAGITHPASVSDDLGSARTTTFTMAASDAAPSAIEVPVVDDAVNEESETFTVTIEPGTGYAVGSPGTVTVTINDNDPPAAPGSLELTAGDAKLDVEWAKPTGPVAGYVLRWKETSATDRDATTAGDPSTGWVRSAPSRDATTAEITGLTNGTSYDVRIRADDGQLGEGNGLGPWTATESETPNRPVSDVPRNVRAAAGDAKLTLTWQAPSSWGTRTGRGYRIEWKLSSGASSDWSAATGGGTLGPSVTSYEFSGAQTDADGSSHTVANGTSYDLRIRASSLKPGTDGSDPSHIEHSAWVEALDNEPDVPSQGGVLVSNLGQLRFAQNAATAGVATAQGFTTGSNVGGYALSSIAAEINTGTTRNDQLAAIRAELWSAAEGGGPGAKLADLKVPSTVAAGTVSFDAPAFTWLSANTTYFFVPYTTTNFDLQLGVVSSHAEDSSSQPGWSILDGFHWRTGNLPGASWNSVATVLAISVHGAAEQIVVPTGALGLQVTPGPAKLDLAWTVPFGVVTGYDVHYTSSQTVGDDAAAGTSVTTEWVAASRTETDPPTTTQTISGLTNDTPYRVRVRAKNGMGPGAWVFGSGTPKATTTGSTDATLSALALTSADSSGSSTFAAEELSPAFDGATYAYTATVAATKVVVKVTPTVNESNATVKVGIGASLTSVESDSASAEIELAYGANVIAVEVTAEAGNTQRYAITVNRPLPVLSWAETTGRTCPGRENYDQTTCSEGDAATLGLDAEAANVMSGTVTYAAGATHPASLTEDLGSGRSTTFTMAASDDDPSAIEVPSVDDALNEYDETFTVTIEPGTGYTVGQQATLSVTIVDNDRPAAPGSFKVARGDTELTASWSKPAGPVDNYVLRWKETSAPDQVATMVFDPSTGWVQSGSLAAATTSRKITDLDNGTSYDVRVRADDGQAAAGNGVGPWTATQSETPQPKTYEFKTAEYNVPPGTAVSATVELSYAAPAGGLELTLTRLLGTALPVGLCTAGAQVVLAEADDIGSNPPASVTVDAGETEAEFDYPTVANGDDLVLRSECFGLRLGTSATGWTAGEDAVAKVDIEIRSAAIAMGSSAGATAKHTQAVAENVTGGTLSVPVTVDHLPYQSQAFAIEVLGGSTATENTDFGIAAKSVTFGPGTPKTQNLTVSITNDVAVEADETIELRIAAPGATPLDSAYSRHAQGRLATITIRSEDAVPGAVRDLTVASRDTALAVSWKVPANTGSSALTGYDVHYTSAPSSGTGSVADDEAASGMDPAAAWVDAGHSGTTVLSKDIKPLANGTAYRVRVRAVNAVGGGAWARGTGTPRRRAYGFSASTYTGQPGETQRVTVSLSEAAPTGGLALTVTRLLGTALPTGLCTTGAQLVLAEADDIGTNPPGSVTVPEGDTEASFNFAYAANGDDLVSRAECFGLRLGTSATGWTAGDNAVAKFTIVIGSAAIAMGSSAGATAKHTQAVAENVAGGTLSVPVTVDHLPYQSTTFAIEVLSGSTATENTDFGIAAKSVTFGPGTSRTRNLTVSITDDVAVEANETIELRLADGPGTSSVNDAYSRHAQGRLATITIRSEDAVPGAVRDLTVASSDTTLAVNWRVPANTGSSALTGYDVHYTSAAVADVADDEAASGTDPSAAWVDAGHTGTTALSQEITPLTNGTTYRVRVRAVNGSGGGAWSRGTGTPSETPSVSLDADPNPVGEGSGVTITAKLSRALTSSVTIPVTVERGTSEAGDHGTLANITVNANAATGTGAITTAHDADADDETFTVALGSNLPSSVVAGSPSEVEVTITDDEKPTVSLSASPDPVTEGEAVTITATLTAVLSTQVTIPVTVERVSSESGDHGTLSSITIPAGDFGAGAQITTAHDAGEDDETFTVSLGSPLPAAVLEGSPSEVVVRIADDEGIPAVTLAASPNPVDEGEAVTITATLSKALASSVRIPLTLTAGTAETADHWTLSAITVSSGATTGEGTIRTNQDLDTDDETFAVEVDEANLPQAVRAGDPDSVLVTITDDDKAEVTLTASPNPVDEGSAVTVTARLSKALPSAVTIPLALSRGTAEEGDHGALESITVRAGRTSATGVVTTVRDEDEEDETFTVALGSPLPSAALAGDPSEVEVTIRDDGPLRAELASSTLRPAEGSSARLTATLNHPAPAGGVRVRFHGDGGSGDNPASPVGDFTLAPAPAGESVTDWIDIAEGERRATGWLRVVNDDEPEDDETVAVWLRGSWTNDYPEIELTIPANDGGGGSGSAAWIDAEPNPVTEGRDVTIRVHLTRALEADATIPLTVRRGTSEAGDHGSLDEIVIAAGETAGSGTIETTRDADADDETFTVRLGSPLPAGVRAGTASSVEVVIDDRDEPRAWLEVEPNPVDEGNPVTVTAKLDGALSRSVTIPIEVERVTSEQGDHGTLSSIRIASGRIEGTGRITTRRDDDGDDEEFTVSLGELPSGVERGHPESVEVVIVDEGGDAPATVSLGAAPDPVPEGESVTVTATLDKALERTVTIPVTVERGTSEAGDHGSLSGIRIASGQVEGTGTITTRVDDDTDDETFTVALRTNLPAGVEAGTPSSFEVTIADRGGEFPGRVRSLRVTAGDGRLDLTWSAPSSGTVTAYVTAYRKRSASEWIQLHEDDYQDTKAAIEALENGTRYDVRVRASNDYGDGPWATGSGTPTAGGNNSNQLTSLSVRVSKDENGTYRSVSLSPSFRSSVTAYRVTAPAGTKYAKFRPRAASSTALILVHGHEVASGAESPAISVNTGVAYWTAVIPSDNSTAGEYSVTFTIPSASMDAARSSVTAAVDAALAMVGTLSPEDAAGALLGEKSLGEARTDALDRLGNANGRYDVGDLLAWIDRCRGGGAKCGNPPRTTPPASAAALPGAAGAVGAAAKRPRRRPPGGRKPPKRRRRFGGLAVLLAAALWSCDGGSGLTAPEVLEPGTLAVEWTAPARGPQAAGALVEIDGPRVGDARAPGLQLYATEATNGLRRFVIAGDMRNGPVLEFRVPDRRQAGLYSVRVVEVAGADHRLLDADAYRAAIAPN